MRASKGEASRKSNDALVAANGVCASHSAPRRPLVNVSAMICPWSVRPQLCRARTKGEIMPRTWQTRSKNGEAQGWLRKGSGKAPASHKPLGHREICAKHSANGKPNALPCVRAQGAHGKTVCTQPFSKKRLYQIRCLLGWANRCTTTACGSPGGLAPPCGRDGARPSRAWSHRLTSLRQGASRPRQARQVPSPRIRTRGRPTPR